MSDAVYTTSTGSRSDEESFSVESMGGMFTIVIPAKESICFEVTAPDGSFHQITLVGEQRKDFERFLVGNERVRDLFEFESWDY